MKTKIIDDALEFAHGMRERTQVNRQALTAALQQLRHFSSLREEARVWICSTLLRNGEVDRLLYEVKEPASIPLRVVGSLYRDVSRRTADPEGHPFLRSEYLRLKEAIAKEEWMYKNKSLREEGEFALIRLFYLLEALGNDGHEAMFQIASSVYDRFSWLPAEVKDRHMSRILLERRKAENPHLFCRSVVRPLIRSAAA